MKGLLSLIAGFLGGVIASLLLPNEQREKLSRQLAGFIGGMAEQMPEG